MDFYKTDELTGNKTKISKDDLWIILSEVYDDPFYVLIQIINQTSYYYDNSTTYSYE